jgi:hypothetical protein
LLDEQLDDAVAPALNALSRRHGMTFESLRKIGPGTKDSAIPALCGQRGFDALVSANVKDFGARLPLYERLLESDISVVVVRPGHETLTPEVQVSILSLHSREIGRRLSDKPPTLLRVTRSEVKERSLDELRNEILGEERQLP